MWRGESPGDYFTKPPLTEWLSILSFLSKHVPDTSYVPGTGVPQRVVPVRCFIIFSARMFHNSSRGAIGPS